MSFDQEVKEKTITRIGYPPLINDCIPAEKLLWMRVTSVWDDVLHHGTFNNLLDVVELAVSKHNGAAILQSMSYTGSHLNYQSDQSEQNLPQQAFFPSTVFHHDVGDRVRAEACKKTTLKQVTDIEEE